MNKKALYESIMKNVAKQVKKALNEGEYADEFSDDDIQWLGASDEDIELSIEDLWDNLVTYNIATEDELKLVTDINGYSEKTLLSVLCARTGLRSWDQYLAEEA